MQFQAFQLDHREGLILQLIDNEGGKYLSEIAPLPGFSKETFTDVKTEMINMLATKWCQLAKYNSHYKSIQFALDSLFINCGKKVKTQQAEVDNIPLLQGDKISIEAQYKNLGQVNLIKLKVARECVDSDIAVFNMLCQLNPLLKIRCDANQAWSKQQAASFFSAINTQQLDYIEEPTCNHQTNLALAEQYNVYLGLDETLQNSDFCYQHHHSIKAFIIKPTLIGHLKKIDQLVSIAQKYGLMLSFSSSFESVIGLQALKNLASYYIAQPKSQALVISLGIDTLKYFDSTMLIDAQKMEQDCQQLELLWTSH